MESDDQDTDSNDLTSTDPSYGNMTTPATGFKDYEYNLTDLALPWDAQIGLIVLYGLTIVLSITGNMLVIVVLISAKRTRTEINVFLINLAIADLCMACFCIPFSFTRTMLGRWIFGQFMCPLVLFMQVLSVTVSIYTNMAIGIDRFWGVVFPMRPKLTKSMARVVTAGIWLFSMTVASAQLFVSRSNQQEYRGVKFWDCNERWPTLSGRHVYTVVITCLVYFLPLSILAAVYSRIGSILWSHRAPGEADGARDKILLRSKQRVITVVKMVFTLVVVFALCWFPLHMFTLVLDFAPQVLDHIRGRREHHIFIAVYYACHWLAMANSFANPIIFCFLNDNFRADLRSVLFCHANPGRCRHSLRMSGHSSRSLARKLSRRLSSHRHSSTWSSASGKRRNNDRQIGFENNDMPSPRDVNQESLVDELVLTPLDHGQRTFRDTELTPGIRKSQVT